MPALAIGDGVREPPPSFTPPQSMSPSVQVQASSTVLLLPGPTQSAYIRAADADVVVQDEWVTLTRNLTLLSARGSNELEIDLSGSREETMMVRNFEHPCSVLEKTIVQKLITSRHVTRHTESR